MRIILIALLLGSLIAPNIPTLAGLAYWWSYDAQMDMLEAQGIDIIANERDAGWRRSTITTEFGYVDLQDLPRITAVSRVEHGPLRADGEWLLAKGETRLYVDGHPLTPEDQPAPIRNRVTFGSHVNTLIDFPEQNIPLDGGGRISFDGLIALYDNQPRDRSDPFFRYAMAGMSLTTPEIDIQLGRIEGTLELKHSPAGNVLADHVVVLHDLQIIAPDKASMFAMSHLEAVSESDVEDGEIVGSSALSLDQLDIGGTIYGPLVAKAFTGGWNDVATFEAGQEWQRLQRELRLMDPEDVGRAMHKFWRTDGWPVLTGNPHMRLDPIAVTTAQGDIVLSLEVSANGIQKGDILKHTWLKKLSAELSLSAPTAAIASISYTLEAQKLKRQGEREGWYSETMDSDIHQAAEAASLQALEAIRRSGVVALSADESSFEVYLSLSEGQVTLNNTTVDPMQFLPALMNTGAIPGGNR